MHDLVACCHTLHGPWCKGKDDWVTYFGPEYFNADRAPATLPAKRVFRLEGGEHEGSRTVSQVTH